MPSFGVVVTDKCSWESCRAFIFLGSSILCCLIWKDDNELQLRAGFDVVPLFSLILSLDGRYGNVIAIHVLYYSEVLPSLGTWYRVVDVLQLARHLFASA